ncbi:uncharacterized protein LOC131164832 isoform X2 [Malania oleifera]|uniref:uncharacterized protein LOC131164832 isoform X2 n=1 Tax=Malania oleifera TaxID=397392 RepID=UPI0025ADEE37|nr:uncharacterized protein LOC131164832 isoform X2 [Malania oleifera]
MSSFCRICSSLGHIEQNYTANEQVQSKMYEEQASVIPVDSPSCNAKTMQSKEFHGQGDHIEAKRAVQINPSAAQGQKVSESEVTKADMVKSTQPGKAPLVSTRSDLNHGVGSQTECRKKMQGQSVLVVTTPTKNYASDIHMSVLRFT